MSTRLFYGSIINPISVHKADFIPRALVAVSPEGIIDWIIHGVLPSEIQSVALENGLVLDDLVDVYELKYGEWLMPGFVDTHTHAPQFPNIGIGGQFELLDWLRKVTFPTEKRYNDPDFAKRMYDSVVERILNSGTTTCCYYGTLHLEATKVLAKIVHDRGQRAFVGKCNMDYDPAPDPYKEPSAEKSMADTETLISYIRSLPSTPDQPLVHPVLTPRFALSCTPKLLQYLGERASKDSSLAIQTHISENLEEIQQTLKRFPDCKTYAGVYQKFKLLTNRTILAHGVHLTNEEIEIIRETKAGISHCPTSNFYLNSGVARVGELLDLGVGLGTDCSGGFSPSILTTVRDAGIASKIIAMIASGSLPTPPAPPVLPDSDASKLANKTLPLSALLYLATLGGAELCNLESKIGSFAPGKEFDAVLVSVRPEAGNANVWANLDGVDNPLDPLDHLLEKFFFCGDNRNVRKVWVRGRLVGGVDK